MQGDCTYLVLRLLSVIDNGPVATLAERLVEGSPLISSRDWLCNRVHRLFDPWWGHLVARHCVPVLTRASESLTRLFLLHKLILETVVETRLHVVSTVGNLPTVFAVANVH